MGRTGEFSNTENKLNEPRMKDVPDHNFALPSITFDFAQVHASKRQLDLSHMYDELFA